MSRPLDARDMEALLRRKDLVSLIIDLQRDLAKLQRDVNQGSRALGWEITTPAVPASNAAEFNNNLRPVTVYIRGGTVTNITVAGTALGVTSGTFRVIPGDSISITYSVAPTWFWYGD